MDLGWIDWANMFWIDLVQEREKWRAVHKFSVIYVHFFHNRTFCEVKRTLLDFVNNCKQFTLS
jgi:hypothetical protein